MRQLDEEIAAAFPFAAFIANRHLINHMRRICLSLNMDLDTTYIWGTLAHLNMAQSIGSAKDSRDLYDEEGNITAVITPISLASLSQVTGFPRETVRRKLDYLKTAGKITRNDDGDWLIASEPSNLEVYEFTKETVRLLLEAASQIDKALIVQKKMK